MIEIDYSRTGLPILKSAGRHLNSSYDPIHEAQRWLVPLLPKLKNFDHIVILGMGSVYHCLALLKAVPQKSLYIIEKDAELVRQGLSVFAELQQVPLSLFHDASEILASSEVLKLLEKNIYVVRMPSTHLSNEGFFAEAALSLYARRPRDFKRVCERRPEFHRQLSLKEVNETELISIHDFLWLNNEVHLTPERRAFLLLKELVK